MKATRIIALLTLAASLALVACGGGGSGNSALPTVAPTSNVDAYTGPAPATADVQAFEVNLWNNIRGQNRCGQCHNATTPAQMPNFARSDNVNLAYAQANTVVNLQTPSTSIMVVKVSGGHNCWLADASACGQILTTWISNWANATGASSATQVQLVAPPVRSVGQSLNLPSGTTGQQDYSQTIYTLTGQYCSKCHSSTADPAVSQSPYFADGNIATAYQAAIPKIDFTGCVPQNSPTFAQTCGTNSRFYQRLLTDKHNCWSDCATDAGLMLAQIQAFAMMLTPSSIDPNLVVSKALALGDGTIASGGGRFDADTIAKYLFAEGSGYTAYDTSGIDPSADLTITGNVTFAGGWGVLVGAGGKLQATVESSSKLYTLIQATGEFSIEAWVAPALVAADKSYMVSYSGGDTLRNFTLGQTNQQYDFMLRSLSSGTTSSGNMTAMPLNGMPQLQTLASAMALQASLQHVVLTYDPVNGRQIYVNGVNQNVPDPQKGGSISNWDSTFALVLGNEVSGDRSWQGLIKFVAIHSRALTAAQVMQNYNAGVGERYYLLFNVSNVVNLNQAYIMFTVSQYDSYAYLFYQPTFISLDPTVKPGSIVAKGLRIGINGTIPLVGQAYIPLNTTITAAGYTATGEVLSNIGTVIGLENGPLADQFFLQFDQLGSATNVIVEQSPCTGACPNPFVLQPPAADVGVRSFAQVNSTLAQLTGVPSTTAAVVSTYQSVQQQLPPGNVLESYSSSNQVGVAQLAVQYCAQLLASPQLTQQVLGITLSGSTFNTVPGYSTVSNPLANLAVGGGSLAHQPAASTVSTELNSLIGTLCTGSSPCANNASRVQAVSVAACAAALGNADVMID
ncbi:MAG TPA: LamG domain-containing protein [Steroidobacteraceae bacterium]|nr:LamG domain-containing protein [Steroidobacteraceae bacterium]